MSINSTAHAPTAETRAVQAATAVGRALGRTATFRKYETAQESFMTTKGLRQRFEAYQRRQQEFQNARAWGGVDPAVEQQLDAEWQMLSRTPEVPPHARGHVDCVEFLRGPDARAIPELTVVNDRTKLTQEAGVGSVDNRQIETLMTRPLPLRVTAVRVSG